MSDLPFLSCDLFSILCVIYACPYSLELYLMMMKLLEWLICSATIQLIVLMLVVYKRLGQLKQLIASLLIYWWEQYLKFVFSFHIVCILSFLCLNILQKVDYIGNICLRIVGIGIFLEVWWEAFFSTFISYDHQMIRKFVRDVDPFF